MSLALSVGQTWGSPMTDAKLLKLELNSELGRRVEQVREAIESEPESCFGVNLVAGRAYGVRENLLCIVGLLEDIVARQGRTSDTAEVEELPARWRQEADEIDRLGQRTNTNSIRARADELERILIQQKNGTHDV